MNIGVVGWPTDNAIKWIEELVQERIARDLILRRCEDGVIALVLRGSSKLIRFLPPEPVFDGASPVDDCAYWDCRRDGFASLPVALIPAPTRGQKILPIRVLDSGTGFDVHYDVPGLIYWQLTRSEEITSDIRDQFGRFPAVASHAYRFGYLERPIVDEWILALVQMVERLWPSLRVVKPVFRIEPTHDVDFPTRYGHSSSRHLLRVLVQDLIQKRSIKSAIKGASIKVKSLFSSELERDDPYNTFEWIMQQSEENSLQSHFYFICGGGGKFDPGYSPEHPAIRTLMRRIYDRGHRLGLHPSYTCMDSDVQLKFEADAFFKITAQERIKQSSWGARMHYLRCSYPSTFTKLLAVGLGHDATMGYADRVGFRAGTCFPYWAFDPVSNERLELQVRPLIVMEGTLYSESYMRLKDPVDGLAKIREIQEACANVGGIFSILWHNSELVSPAQKSYYSAAICGR